MKSGLYWGVDSNWGRGIKLGALVLMTTALVACGGSGGGGNDAVDSSTPPSDEAEQTFAVSGAVNGLTGAIQLSDGFQTLDIAADGTFAFAHSYHKSDTFALSVNTGTTDQLCTVTHGAGLILGDVKDVSIDCLETRAANIHVSKPAIYTTFSRLDLRSSYQYAPKLAGETTSLVVAKNQFVTLYPADAQSQPIYLAFIKSFDETTVDALSTAVSLVLLSPSIHGAIEQRGTHFETFVDRFAALPAVIALRDAIAAKADAGKLNLQAPSADLLSLLDVAVGAAADDIIASDSSAAKTDASRSATAANKIQISPVKNSQDGLSLTLQKIAPDASGNNYQLQIANTQQRFIAIESSLLTTPIAVAPGESQTQAFKSDTVNELWTVRGPGAQAAAAPVSPLLKDAVISTATEFYAMPSVTFVAGNLNLLDWRLIVCSDATELEKIRDDAKAALLSDATLDNALRAPQYTAAYDSVAAPLRASIVNHLSDLMECEFFRKGRWLDDHIDTASVQIGTMLNIAQVVYAPRIASANVLVKAGLLAAGNVINTSLTEQQWQLSNSLDIAITQNVNGVQSPVSGVLVINKGETPQLTVGCTDPVSKLPVACTAEWIFAGGSIQGNTFNEALNSSDVITVTATDEDGATASKSIDVTVLELPSDPPTEPPSEPTQSDSYWLLQQGSTTQRFDIPNPQFLQALSSDSDQVAEFRGLVSENATLSYISISLPHFGKQGSYSLNDLPKRSCLGFVIAGEPTDTDKPWSNQWCTKTTDAFAATQVTGSAIYSVSAEGKNIVDFDFQVAPQQCFEPPCSQQHVTGHIEVLPKQT